MLDHAKRYLTFTWDSTIHNILITTICQNGELDSDGSFHTDSDLSDVVLKVVSILIVDYILTVVYILIVVSSLVINFFLIYSQQHSLHF